MPADPRTEPFDHIELRPNSSPRRPVTPTVDMPAGVLVEPDDGSIGNGVKLMTANFGDSNTVEGKAESLEIPAIHPRSSTPYDKTTNFDATYSDSGEAIEHESEKGYWLKGSSLTTVAGKTKLIPAGSGLVKAALAHTSTPLPIHMWVAMLSVSSKTWTQGKYKGMTSSFTA
jgi:hypothetical protein